MSAPTTPILDSFSLATLGGFTPDCWGTTSSFVAGGGNLSSSGGSAMFWTAPFAAGDLECYVQLRNGPHNGAEARLSLSNQIPDLQGYGFQIGNDAGDCSIRRWADNGTETLLASTNEPITPGDFVAFQRIGTRLNYWHLASGIWRLVMSVDDGTYMDTRYVGIRDDGAVNIYGPFGGGKPVAQVAPPLAPPTIHGRGAA